MPAIIALTSLPILRDAVGGSFTPITGTVKDTDNVSLTSAPIELFRRTAGGTTWTSVATTTTDTTGAFSVALPTGLSAGEYEYVVASGGDVSEITKHWVIGSSYVFRYSGGTPSQPIGTLPYASAQSVGSGLPTASLTHINGYDATGALGRADLGGIFSKLVAGKRMLILGDSHTVGTGTTNAVYGFATQVNRHVGTAYFPDALTFRRGHSGERTDQLLARLSGYLDSDTPDVVVLPWGTNDCEQTSVNISTALEYVRQGVAMCLARNLKVIVCTVPPRGTSDANYATRGPRVEAFNLGLRWLAPTWGALVCDTYKALVDPDTGKMPTGIDSDGIHMTNVGHSRWAAALASVLSTLIVSRPSLVSSLGSVNKNLNPLVSGTVGADPANWNRMVFSTGVTAAATIQADASGLLQSGQWLEIDLNATSGSIHYESDVAKTVAPGDVLYFTARVQIEEVTGTWETMVLVDLLAFAGISVINGATNAQLTGPTIGTSKNTVMGFTYTVPAGVTSVRMAAACKLGSGKQTKFRFGELGFFNLTELGLTSVITG